MKKVWGLVGLLLYGISGTAQSNGNETLNQLSLNCDSLFFENNANIEKWLQDNKVPTLGIGLINRGKLNQIKMFGKTPDGQPAPYNTIFNVASLTKPITATVALKLVEQGLLNLDEPLYTYWIDPDIARDTHTRKLTTRLILSHQTGFANWRWMLPEEKLRFDFEPGTAYQYSGEGYEYLRKALENKFKKSLQQLADELIFHPLKMFDTRYFWHQQLEMSRYAGAYDTLGKPYQLSRHTTANAADDLLTSVEDYGNFVASLLSGTLLSETTFKEMVTPQVPSVKGKYFGLGFEIYKLMDNTDVLAHGGSDEGVRVIVFLIPKIRHGLLIFTNADNGVRLYETLVKHYLGIYGKKIFEIETQ